MRKSTQRDDIGMYCDYEHHDVSTDRSPDMSGDMSGEAGEVAKGHNSMCPKGVPKIY
jgi:hypothetical protein